ncbi:MAG: chorismate synthase [Acidobacteriota bacterium]|nr:chorismate synthase [Acidobacteriota bacterium]
MPLRFLTAGESHGPELTVIVEGLPAGVTVDPGWIDRQLIRRMGGHGRGGRMKIEKDRVVVTGGVRWGKTLGSPVSMRIPNLDHANWQAAMSPLGERPEGDDARSVTRPRPGHADLAGALKYGTHDARDILERSSARETAARTAAGALAQSLLAAVGIRVTSHTLSVGAACVAPLSPEDFERLLSLDDDAPMRTLDPDDQQRLTAAVDEARNRRDSVGGSFEILADGVPIGLGSHTHWDRRLDGRLAGALCSIQAVKAVSIGEGIEGASRFGSEQHDEILYQPDRGFVRPTNRAGGIEGGITNGEMIRVSAYFKPLASLPQPLRSVDLVSKEPFEAVRERTDTIPIVAAGVVGEAMMAWVLADELTVKFGGDRLDELTRNLDGYRRSLTDY